MEIDEETITVIRMTRLEATRVIVDPTPLQRKLREHLGDIGAEAFALPGTAVARAQIDRVFKTRGRVGKVFDCLLEGLGLFHRFTWVFNWAFVSRSPSRGKAYGL